MTGVFPPGQRRVELRDVPGPGPGPVLVRMGSTSPFAPADAAEACRVADEGLGGRVALQMDR